MNSYLDIDNRTLIEECKKGDKEAWNLFYHRFAPRMLSVIRRYVHDDNDAEDILHDGFIIAFSRLGTLRDPEKTEYWLATIMRNLALQFLQSQDVAEVLDDVADVEEPPRLYDIIDMETLEMLMLKLPEGYRKVLRLAILENKSHREIARLLRIEPHSSSQLFHAKMMMRKIITDYKKQTGLLLATLLVAAGGITLWRGGLTRQTPPLLSSAPGAVELPASRRPGEASPLSAASGPDGAPSLAASRPAPGRKPSAQRPGGASVLDSRAESGSESAPESRSDFGETHDAPAADSLPGLPEAGETPLVAQADSASSDGNHPSTARDLTLPDDYGPFLAEADPVIATRRNSSFFGNVTVGLSLDAGKYIFGNQVFERDLAFSGVSGGGWAEPDDPGNEDNQEENISPSLMPRKVTDGGVYKSLAHSNDFPITVSFAINLPLTRALSLESGLTYSYLRSTFQNGTDRSKCLWHYLGIPLKLNARAFSYRRLGLYGSAGARIDLPLYSRSTTPDPWALTGLTVERFNSPVVWSLTGSIGFSVRLNDKTALFIEPTLQYRFSHRVHVPNSWSDNRWGFSLPIGFRFICR